MKAEDKHPSREALMRFLLQKERLRARNDDFDVPVEVVHPFQLLFPPLQLLDLIKQYKKVPAG